MVSASQQQSATFAAAHNVHGAHSNDNSSRLLSSMMSVEATRREDDGFMGAVSRVVELAPLSSAARDPAMETTTEAAAQQWGGEPNTSVHAGEERIGRDRIC